MNAVGARYVVVDLDTALAGSRTMLALAGESRSKYVEEYYYRTQEGSLAVAPIFYPEYYRLMSSRLFNFGGEAVVPENTTWGISFTEKKDNRGKTYKEMGALQKFTTYEEAQAYLNSQTSLNFRLVGLDPLQSCVPLEELKGYKLVYQSETSIGQRGEEENVSYIQIFEYMPATSP
jgi:hypothetical protein